jgi:hypothetical protein
MKTWWAGKRKLETEKRKVGTEPGTLNPIF